MLSVANVRSAGGAAGYFAKDNYYAKADADRSGVWVGKGAERLGMSGAVEPHVFEAILRGELPQGGRIGREGVAHRAGTDLTFSLPKSWSLLAGAKSRTAPGIVFAIIDQLQGGASVPLLICSIANPMITGNPTWYCGKGPQRKSLETRRILSDGRSPHYQISLQTARNRGPYCPQYHSISIT